MDKRLAREKATVAAMIKLYCSKHHGSKLCVECEQLIDYACTRVDRCVYGGSKPVCGSCQIHCYKPDMREQICKVMRFSGPRMLLQHPIMAVMHLIDSKKYEKVHRK